MVFFLLHSLHASVMGENILKCRCDGFTRTRNMTYISDLIRTTNVLIQTPGYVLTSPVSVFVTCAVGDRSLWADHY